MCAWWIWMLPALCVLTVGTAQAAGYHVAADGSDDNAGTKDKPFATIQKAADVMVAGDTCVIGGGTYRQTVRPKSSGEKGKPIRFVAARGQKVVLDGTEPITSKWSLYKGRIYKTGFSGGPFEQLFVDRKMQIEARWPNMRFDQLFSRAAWARAGKGSRYGKMVDARLAKTNIDWTGALATMNLAHQFFSWTRTVAEHTKGADTFTYEKNLRGITYHADKTGAWEDDYYYLSGKLEALDAPTEWFHDEQAGLLYLYADNGKSPAGRRVEYKKRTYAFDVDGRDYIELHGLLFFATTFRFANCNHCVVDGCRLVFPTYARRITEFDPERKASPTTVMQGSYNTVRRTSIAYASGAGLKMIGRSGLVENCIIHDVCWSGTLIYNALTVAGGPEADSDTGGSVVRRSTLYNAGNAILRYGGGSHTIEYNHVFNGGLVCKDVALVHTGGPRCAGSVVRYNWVHGCQTERWPGHVGNGGMGIRGDDQTRKLTVHHNVVWDCGIHGIIVKGDHNRVYNNTVFDVGPKDPAKRKPYNSKHLLIPSCAEPKKPWRKQFPLLKVQNANSLFFNNAVGNIVWRGQPLPAGDKITHNVEFGKKPPTEWLANPKKMDFRPKKGSPLIDAGRVIEGFTDGFKGKAPDVGAYESGGKYWKPGADWTDEQRD